MENKLNMEAVDKMARSMARFKLDLIQELQKISYKLDCCVTTYSNQFVHIVQLVYGVITDVEGRIWRLEDLKVEDLVYIYEDIF